jgi:hypothetical protein
MRKPPKPTKPTEINLNIMVGGRFDIAGALTVNHNLINPKPSPPPPIRCVVTATVDGFSVKGTAPMTYKLPDDKQIAVKVAYLDSKGRPAEVDGDVEWESSDTTIVVVTVSPDDSTQALIAPAGEDLLGQVQISATADADVGDGVNHVVCTLDVTLIGGEAVIGTITPVGDPQPYTPDDGSGSTDPTDPHQGVPPNALGRAPRR